MLARVLIVAGSDSGGGAGIQGDIKTVTTLGGFAMTAITALTAQNTEGVHGVMPVPPEFVAKQMEVVLDDLGADAIKIGMLNTAEIVDAVADVIERVAKDLPIVLDPVMIAKGGASLLDPRAVDTLRKRLLPLARVVTPNVPEAEALTGVKIKGFEDFHRAAEVVLGYGAEAVFMKGGHLNSKGEVRDLLVTEDKAEEFGGPRVAGRHTHGTGCTLSSALATSLAQGMSISDAGARARAYVETAILTAPGLGRGHGPLNHLHTIKIFP